MGGYAWSHANTAQFAHHLGLCILVFLGSHPVILGWQGMTVE